MSCGWLALLGIALVIGNGMLLFAYLQGSLGKGIGQTPFAGFVIVLALFFTVALMVFPGLGWLEGRC